MYARMGISRRMEPSRSIDRALTNGEIQMIDWLIIFVVFFEMIFYE